MKKSHDIQQYVGNPLIIPNIVVFAVLCSNHQLVSQPLHHCASVMIFKSKIGAFGIWKWKNV